MRFKKFIYYIKNIAVLGLMVSLIYGFKGDKRGGGDVNKPVYRLNKTTSSGKQGDAYRMNINNINLPFNNKGVLADVNIPPDGTLGRAYGHGFLYSGGFFLSGKRNGTVWANAQATSSLETDYLAGTVEQGQNDPRNQIYVIDAQDEPFGTSWQDWKDAVALGADFYDGNGDGQYDPVDLNGNGKWDPDEDAPDLLGDQTAWCVYNDAVPAAQRRWVETGPLGIEVRQTVFAFASAGAIGNIIFVRYRIKYVGLNKPDDPDALTDCYFGVWADPDIGNATDDLIGSDTLRNSGYTYNNGPDDQYGNQPPCMIIDFFSGPQSYIPGVTFTDNNGNGIFDAGDTPIDTAHSVRGQLKGIVDFPGAKNLPISSFVGYINGDPDLNDPSNVTEARNYMLGLDRVGNEADPCNWAYSEVGGGINCADIDNRFWYSGDPVTGIGWIMTSEQDQRQMQNTGPFTLRKNEVKEIVVAYVVGRGSNAINSISVARGIDDGAQFIFDHNFEAPSPAPPVNPTVKTGDNFIDLTWDTSPQVSYVNKTDAYDLHFEGYNIFAYETNNTSETVNNQQNRVLVGRYTKRDFINDVYKENSNTGGIELLYAAPDSIHQMDSTVYSDPATGRLRIRITEDPFTGGALVKGKPYYFAITSYCLNYKALVFKNDPTQPLGTVGDYYVNSTAFVGEVENIQKITPVTMASDLYDPPLPLESANKITGPSNGEVGYDVVDQNSLTGDEYEVTFVKDSSSSSYSTYWNLTDITANTVKVDSSKDYTFGSEDVSGTLIDGFIPRVKQITPTIGLTSTEYEPAANKWYPNFAAANGTGIYYVGKDIPQGSAITLPNNNAARSNAIHAEDLRRVELRFGTTGKAYRYLNGFIKANPLPTSYKFTYTYAEGVTESDTVGHGPVGMLGQGFVDVPFTAWVVDSAYNEEKQLAVGFIEMSKQLGGNPDGQWDPSDSLLATSEVIVIFNADYDPTGSQMEYTGGDFNGTTVWGDVIRGFDIPDGAPNITPQQKSIASSQWFNAMYVVGLEKNSPNDFYQNGDKLIIPITTYPYTSSDVYRFKTSKGGVLNDADKKALFEKVNVFPNPLFGFNPATSYTNGAPDDPFVTFSNLPEDVTIKIYSLSGNKLRTLTTADKSTVTSPFLKWDLKNEAGLRVASGLYIAIVSSPKYGEKILKFSIIMPQKQLQRY